jgi:hypothetical protein
MKRTAFLLLLIFIGSTSAYSQQTAEVIAENANLRGTPSTEGKVMAVLPNKTVLAIIKQKEAWFLVQAPEYVGWMHGDTIRITGGTPAPCTSGGLLRTKNTIGNDSRVAKR